MRKMVVAVTAMFVLGLAALAYAQQVNTYEVEASTSPTKAGTKKKPVPVGLKFGYTVSEASGNRPSPVKKYSIRFAGMRVNTSVPGKCTLGKLEDGGAEACPKDSIVGEGYIRNETGATANPADKSIKCNAKLWVVNLGSSKASIYVAGSPEATDEREKCQIQLAAPIPAKFTTRGSMSSLDFTVPSSLLHPGAATISNAVVAVESSIKKIKKGGKGFFESIGGCKGGKRAVEVVFTPESGSAKTGKTTARCSS
jgi:hypothetical protein